MEPKRMCCGANQPQSTSFAGGSPRPGPSWRTPIKEFADNCGSRKCKYARAHLTGDPYTTQKLLDKILYLRKTLHDLENAHQQLKFRESAKRDAPCQTPDLTPTDIYNIRDIVSNCITEMTKLKDFLNDDNCWWQIFKRREFKCCEQKLPHLHGFLDGAMVTLKMHDESQQVHSPILDNGIATSTPKRRTTPESRRRSSSGSPDVPRLHVDMAVETRRSVDFGNAGSTAPQCPVSCNLQAQMISASIGTDEEDLQEAGYQGPTRPEDSKRRSRDQDKIFYTLPDASPDTNAVYLSKGPMDHEQTQDEAAYPSITFSSENMAKRSIIAQDMSTSMEALPPTMIDSVKLQDLTERSFSLNSARSPQRDLSPRVKKQAQQK